CRVYLHPGVERVYTAYIQHEEEMRKSLRRHRGKPLREWRRLFYLDRRLAPTRRNVLRSPYLRPRLRDGWFIPKAPHLSPEEGRRNREWVRRLDELHFEPHEQYPQHTYASVR